MASKNKKTRSRPRVGFRFAPTEYKFVLDMARLVGVDMQEFAHSAVMRQANAVYSRAQALAKQEQEAQQDGQSTETAVVGNVPSEAASESSGSNLLADTPPANGAPGGT